MARQYNAQANNNTQREKKYRQNFKEYIDK